jgi:hypothetical protein
VSFSDDSGELNAMVDGRKVLATFGFCNIRGFSEVNEHLQENIVLFVNEVSQREIPVVCALTMSRWQTSSALRFIKPEGL